MSKNPDEIFSEVDIILSEFEGQFISREYPSPYTAYVDYATWRGIQHYVQSNRIGSIASDGEATYIQYQNWRIFGQVELKNEIIIFPSGMIRKKLN